MNIEEDQFDQAILSAGNWLGHFHLGEPNRKLPSGQGRIPWLQIMQSLKQIRYDGMLVMEPFVHMGGEIGRDIKVWRDLSGNAGEPDMDTAATAALAYVRDLLRQAVTPEN